MNFIFKLFGWLFSNIFLILVVVAACYAYVYWDDPFGEDTPAGKAVAMFSDEIGMAKSYLADAGIIVADETTGSASTAAEPQQDVTAGTGSVDASEVGQVEISQQSVGDGETERESESRSEVEASTAMSASNTEAAAPVGGTTAAHSGAGDAYAMDSTAALSSTGDASAMNSSAEPRDVVAAGGNAEASQDTFVTPEIEQALSQLHNDGSMDDAKTMQQVDKPAKQLMIDARNAFYKRDYETCISSYKNLIALEKDNFNALGELGNVYFTQGRMKEAADAYYQAAMIMVSHGENQRAASLIGFLSAVNAEKAKKLGAMLVPDEQQQGAL